MTDTSDELCVIIFKTYFSHWNLKHFLYIKHTNKKTWLEKYDHMILTVYH